MLAVGIVFDYNAEKKLYRVSCDLRSEVLARRIMTGADKPFPPQSRVILMKVQGAEWLILGEVDMVSIPESAQQQKTVDESAAELINQVKKVRETADLGELPDFRTPGEEIQFIGDASIENRTDAQESRSRVKVYSFGSVLSFASNFCHTLWNRQKSQILQQSRNLVERCIGYLRTITTPIDTNLSTIRETAVGDAASTKEGQDALTNRSDREVILGHIPAVAGRGSDLMTEPTAEFGERVKYRDHFVREVDNDTGTVRQRHDTVDEDGNSTIEIQRWDGNIEEADGKVGTVIRYQDWLEIRIDSDTNEVRIEDSNSDQRILMTTDSLYLERGEAAVELTDEDLALSARNIDLTAQQNVTIEASRVDVKSG